MFWLICIKNLKQQRAANEMNIILAARGEHDPFQGEQRHLNKHLKRQRKTLSFTRTVRLNNQTWYDGIEWCVGVSSESSRRGAYCRR